MIKSYYYAIDKDGQGWFFDYPPIFDGYSWNVNPEFDDWESGVNDLHISDHFGFLIPENMTWEDEPIKFEIEI